MPRGFPGTYLALGLPIPELDVICRCPGGQEGAIPREDHRGDLAPLGMAERSDQFPCFHLPQLDLTDRPRSQGTVEGERHRVDYVITRQQRLGAREVPASYSHTPMEVATAR